MTVLYVSCTVLYSTVKCKGVLQHQSGLIMTTVDYYYGSSPNASLNLTLARVRRYLRDRRKSRGQY